MPRQGNFAAAKDALESPPAAAALPISPHSIRFDPDINMAPPSRLRTRAARYRRGPWLTACLKSPVANRRQQRTAFEADTGHSVFAAGMRLHAPYPTLAQLNL